MLPISKIEDSQAIEYVYGDIMEGGDGEPVTVKLVESLPDKNGKQIKWWQQLWKQLFGTYFEDNEGAPVEGSGSGSKGDDEDELPSTAKSSSSVKSNAPEKSEKSAQKKPQVFIYNNQNYIASGDPQFYAYYYETKEPVAPIFRIEALVPEPLDSF